MIIKNILLEKKLYLTLFCFLLALYAPFILYGDFVRDDWFLRDLKQQTAVTAFNTLLGAFSNRPFAIIFFWVTSRLSDAFIFYLILDLIILFFSIILIFRIFEEFFQDFFIKVTFLVSLMIPIYSMTNIFSPGMQILGHVSLLIWSLSLYSQKIFLETKNKKYLFLSFILIPFMLLTYESAFPLIGLSFFYSIFKKQTKYTLLISLLLFSGVAIAFLVQKFFLPLFVDDISRFRVENENVIFILRLILINIALQINILFIYFENIHLALFDLFSNYFFTIYFVLLLIVFFLFIQIFQKKNLKFFIYNNFPYKINFFSIILCFGICIFLISLMHTVAKSGVSFWGYNNRALLSLSVILSLSVSLFYEIFKYKKILKFIIIFFITLKFLYLFAFQLNHISYTKKIKSKAIEISKLFSDTYENISFSSLNKEILIIFFSQDNFSNLKLFKKTTFINDSFDFRYLMNDISDKYLISDLQLENDINFYKRKNTEGIVSGNYATSGFFYIKGYHLNNFKYCNKSMWDNYFREYIKKDSIRDTYLIFDNLNEKVTKKNLIKISNYDQLVSILDDTTKCSDWSNSKNNILNNHKNLATELSGKSNLRKLFYYDSIFLRFLIKIYNSYFKDII